MLEEEFLRKLESLRPRLLSRAKGGAGGSRKSKMLGTSAEFSDFREYVPGDDIRRIDWNAFARFEKLFLKLFMEEQESFMTVLLDGSASMENKWPAACKIAEAFAYTALCGGDRVRMAVMGGKQGMVSSFGMGKGDYLRLSSFLSGCRPEGSGSLSRDILRLDHYPKGMTLLVSDFLCEDGGKDVLTALGYRGQESCAVQVLSPQEMEPDFTGHVRLLDSEGLPDLILSIDDEVMRTYQAELKAFLELVQKNCHRSGVPFALMNCGEKVEDVFIRRFLSAGILSS